LSVFKKSGYW